MKRKDALRKELDRHQLAAVNWAHRRIAKRGRVQVPSKHGPETYRQAGVVFADGVGRGKTWEAMVACARLLESQGRQTSGGAQRENQKRARSHVLVIAPPGLVHKWAHEELRNPTFVAALEAWKEGSPKRLHAARTLSHIVDVSNKSHMQPGAKARVQKKWSKHRLDGGTYVVNVNLLVKGPAAFGSSASPGRRLFDTDWDVVIIDEAHHKVARAALANLKRFRHLLLLTATPFQLSPGDLRQPLTWLVERSDPSDNPGRRLLSHPPIGSFMDSVNDSSTKKGDVKIVDRAAAERVLRNLISRSRPPPSRREYFVIGDEGALTGITDPWLWTDEQARHALTGAVEPDATFRTTYVAERLRLLASTSDFVPNALRQLLSTFEQYGRRKDRPRGATLGKHPKVEAIAVWFERQFKKDLDLWMRTGIPRKTIVFLRFVGDRDAGTRRTLLERLGSIAKRVLETKATATATARAKDAVEILCNALTCAQDIDGRTALPLEKVKRDLRALAKTLTPGNPIATLLACAKYVSRIAKWIRSSRKTYEQESRALLSDTETSDLEHAARNRRRAILKRQIKDAFKKDIVEAFTGIETDRAGTASRFRSPWLPWVLVASHVAEEGIDLQTYTRHLVHYEIEWNPARMEQREGRGDRRGRLLADPLAVYFPLVAKTYEERMLHQLVMRMRWHGVLLGKGAKELAEDEGGKGYRSVGGRSLRAMQLDLTPRR